MGNISVLQTNTREQLDYVYAKQSSYLDNIRSRMNAAKRKIINLQTELSNLKLAQLKVQQEMNRNTKLNDIQKYYPSDRYQTNDYIQAIKPIQGYGPDPDPRLNYARNHLLKGNEQYEAEKNRIENEILRRNREINEQRQILIDCQNMLNAIGATASTAITKDDISKRQYTEIYMLYQIHTQYATLTNRKYVWGVKSEILGTVLPRGSGTDLTKKTPLDVVGLVGERKFSSDTGNVKAYNKLINMFRFYAERSPFVVSGDLILDFDGSTDTDIPPDQRQPDPGSIFNEKSLYGFLNRLRLVMSNEEFKKYDTDTLNYTNQMVSNVVEPFISQNTQRQVESSRVPTPSNSLQVKTALPQENVNTFINAVTSATTIGWDCTSLIQSTLSNFNNWMSGLYGMPFCSPSTETDPTSQRQVAADASRAVVEQQSATIFSAQFAKTKETVNSDKVIEIADNLLAGVSEETTNRSNYYTAALYTLTVGVTNYVGNTLYRVRILNHASRLLDYLNDAKIAGNIDETTYNKYIRYLNQILDEVWGRASLQITDGTGSFSITS